MKLKCKHFIQVIATGMTGSGKTHSLFGGGDGSYGSHGLVERIVEVRFRVWGLGFGVWGLGFGVALWRES